MERADIIRMALEAGFLDRKESCPLSGESRFDEEICVGEYPVGEIVERFAALVAVEKDKEIARLIDALKSVLRFVATQAVGCHGYKCREAWCWSCFDEEDAQKAAEQGADAADKAQALIRARGEK